MDGKGALLHVGMGDQDFHEHGHTLPSSHDVRESPSPPGFLSHSTSSLPGYLLPSVDDKPSARQKRKRTSPEDQAILEAAYKRDPKPEKAARLALVERVALGEKEVQIWFQNRRQSSRRKTRPLLPHEIAQYQMARLAGSSQQSGMGTSSDESSDLDHSVDLRQETDDDPRQSSHPGTSHIQSSRENSVPIYRNPASQDLAGLEPESLPDTKSTFDPTLDGTGPTFWQPVEHGPVVPANIGDAHNIGHSLIDGQNLQQSGDSQSTLQVAAASQPRVATKPSRGLKKTRSCIRLSMSCDGNASVITKDGSSPSPPRAYKTWVLPTNGSNPVQSGTGVDSQTATAAPYRYLHRSLSGRSRDSRAWEFWCDKDARMELEEKAEKDLSGSAASAIGLLRSASDRRVLGSIPAKRNSILSRHALSSKRSKLHDKQPQFQRSHSSLGKLQGTASIKDPNKAALVLKQSESAASVYIPGNESDKENWSPGGDGRVSNDRQAQKTFSGHLEAHGGARAREMANCRQGLRSKHQAIEGVDLETDVEVKAFMRGGRKSTSMSSEDDLDCVQGLLSLSQGNWR